MTDSKARGRKTVGIIGGMGPAATCMLFQRIVAQTPARRDQDHLHLIIDNNPTVPDRTEAVLGRGPSPVPSLVRSAKLLETSGAAFLAMPCVSAHAFIADIRKAIDIPVVSIIDETLRAIARSYPSIGSIGLLATDGALHADVFGPLRSQYAVLVPSLAQQRNVMSAIYGPNGVKSVGTNEVALDLISRAAASVIDMGAQLIIAGCTEVALAIGQEHLSTPVLDTLEILAAGIVRRALDSSGNHYAEKGMS